MVYNLSRRSNLGQIVPSTSFTSPVIAENIFMPTLQYVAMTTLQYVAMTILQYVAMAIS